MLLPFKHSALPVLVLAGLASPCPASLAAHSPSVRVQDDEPARRSLEDLLRQARAERDQILSELRAGVQVLLDEMESATVRVKPEKARELREQMQALGPEVAPLLLASLHLGSIPSRGDRFRAMQVVQVLRHLRSPSIGKQLLESCQKGDTGGRINSLRVLAADPNPERILAGVRAVHAAAQAEVRTSALLALAELGATDLAQLLATDFAQIEIEQVGSLLRGLAQIERNEIPPCVVQLLAAERAPDLVSPLLAYHSTRKELFHSDEHLLALIKLACQSTIDGNDAVQILNTLSQFDVTVKGATKRALDGLRESSQLNLRESALILLARSRDKAARRSLLQKFDERVKSRPSSTSAYTDRGDVKYLIAEYQSAIKDYKTAISLQRGLASRPDAHLGIARSYARLKRYSDAEEYLGEAPVSMTTLRELASDPAFGGMLESKYRRAFHLRE